MVHLKKADAIVLAAGYGKRSEFPNKIFELLQSKPVFWHALKTLREHPCIDRMVLVIRSEDHERVNTWLDEWGFRNIKLAYGGATRQASAQNGFKALRPKPDGLMLFHNAANPFITSEEITETLQAALDHGAAAVAHLCVATVKEVDGQRIILKTVDRSSLWKTETPQVVSAEDYQKAIDYKCVGTDEMSLIESLGKKAKIIPASRNNFKITTSRDMEFARFLTESKTMHTGIGLDSHRFDRNHRGLSLGGLKWKDYPRFEANSDGDVMIHALCNAIFQAMGEGSLGTFANDMFFQEGVTDSRIYLEHVLSKMKEAEFTIQNIGFQLEGKAPQIDPIALDLKKNLAQLLNIQSENIGITATTGEDLTPFGRGEGLQCLATVTLVKYGKK